MGRYLAGGLKHVFVFAPIPGKMIQLDYFSNGLTEVVMRGCRSTACRTSKQDLPLGGTECWREFCCMTKGDGSSSKLRILVLTDLKLVKVVYEKKKYIFQYMYV